MALKSSAQRAANTVLSYSVTGPAGSPPVITYTQLGEVTNISTGPGQAVTQNDVTNIDSEAMEFVPGLVNNGSITVDINYVPSNASLVAIQTAADNATMVYLKLVTGDTGAFTFTCCAHVETVTFTPGNADLVLKGSITFRVTGKVTRTP